MAYLLMWPKSAEKTSVFGTCTNSHLVKQKLNTRTFTHLAPSKLADIEPILQYVLQRHLFSGIKVACIVSITIGYINVAGNRKCLSYKPTK